MRHWLLNQVAAKYHSFSWRNIHFDLPCRRPIQHSHPYKLDNVYGFAWSKYGTAADCFGKWVRGGPAKLKSNPAVYLHLTSPNPSIPPAPLIGYALEYMHNPGICLA